MGFNAAQITQLLAPINGNRVLLDGKKHSHVSQQDILAHLIRVFGFGAFDIEVLSSECVFESERVDSKGVGSNRFDVCYRAMVRLTVRDPDDKQVCRFENGSTATAQNQTRGDAHDLAYKSAISLSVKRAAIALGDQFGLSLYNKGQLAPLVRGTLIRPSDDAWSIGGGVKDMQEGVPQQVSLGNDETETEDVAPAEPPPKPAAATRTMSRKKPVKDVPLPVEQAPAPAASPPPVAGVEMISGQQSKMLHALLNKVEMGTRDMALGFLSDHLKRDLTTTKELTKSEAHRCIEELVRLSGDPSDEPAEAMR